MTRSPLSSLASVNLILGRVDGACWANAAAANASMASSFMKAPDGNTYSTRWRGNPAEMVGRPAGSPPMGNQGFKKMAAGAEAFAERELEATGTRTVT